MTVEFRNCKDCGAWLRDPEQKSSFGRCKRRPPGLGGAPLVAYFDGCFNGLPLRYRKQIKITPEEGAKEG